MLIHQVNDDIGWKRLLSYCMDYLRKENCLYYMIGPENIPKSCRFLPHVDGSFLRETSLFAISIQRNHETEIEELWRFALGELHSRQRPDVCLGYPFFVDSDHNLIPLLYVDVASQQIDQGVRLISTNTKVKVNSAALQVWNSQSTFSPGDVQARFDELAESGRARFDQALDLFFSTIEETSGEPAARVNRKEFEPQQLPRHAVVECPVLFYARAGDTDHLLKELNQLKEQHRWDTLQSALRHLLGKSDQELFPEIPDPDRCIYVVPADDSQRKAVVTAGQYLLTVVTAPVGANRSQVILNIVGDAVLRGETILVASSDSETTGAIFEQFSTEFSYPGIVQSGEEFQPQMLTAMQRALADVRQEDITSSLEQARSEYEESARLVDEQRDRIALTDQLETDRGTWQLEIQGLLEALPETIRTCVRKDRIRFGQDDEQELSAAIVALLQDVQNAIAQHKTLGENVREVLVTNQNELPFLRYLEDAEQQLGAATSLRRPDVDLENLPAIRAYMAAWEDLLEALLMEENVQQLRAAIVSAEHQVEPQQQNLPADLLAALDDAVETFDQQQERHLRQELPAIESEARQATFNYRRLVEKLDDLQKRSEVVTHWLLGAMTIQPDDSVPWRLEDILDRAFAIMDDVLNAHRLGTARAGLVGLPDRLRQDRDHKTAELEDLLARLEEQASVAQARVLGLILPRVETAVEIGDHKAWQKLATQMEEISTWASRIEAGDLTSEERLQKTVSRGWAIKQLRRKLKDLSIANADLLALNPVEEPPRKMSFKFWAEYVHIENDFVQACALTTHRDFVRQALESHQVQSEDEINAKSAELEETEIKYADSLAQLPETIAESMSEGTWPFGPIDERIARDLDALQEQYQRLKVQYTSWEERLAAIERDQTLPEALRRAIQTLLSNRERWVEQGMSWITPLAVLDLVSTWLHFLQATEIEYELGQLRPNLAEAETSLDALWAKLPSGMRQELDWSRVMPSDELVRSMQRHLSDLNVDVSTQVEEWNGIKGRAIALLQQNDLDSQVLGKALKKAQKDPNCLAELLNETYEHPERLLDHLRIWQQIIQIWRLRAQRTLAGAQLKEIPSRDEAQSALTELGERRADLVGRLLTEQWRHVAAELEPTTIRSIDQYLSAIDASAGEKDSKQRAEEHYGDALKLFPVWLTTHFSTQNIPLQPGLFDTIVIDAASQCDVPSALPLLFRGKRIVVIGDEHRPGHVAALPDSVSQQLAERHNIEIETSTELRSLFDLAANSIAGGPGQVRLNATQTPNRAT